ncbi:MAG TPA: iron-sulfur cluster-binding protein, partial [Lactococcus sp.]|nr:iron-sulfur cluster-binding protein [Lactococcus sp.]
EVSVGGSLFKYGAVRKAPALAKGWTDVRDLPIAPPHKEQFRHWYKKHKAGK